MRYGLQDIGREVFARTQPNENLRQDEFWALHDVSFNLGSHEAIGLLGRNGAGKTTMLRLLNGLIKPDRGSICIEGRVAALIDLGAGFAPVLTGRENIYINAAILGLSKSMVDSLIAEIIDFAEIGEFIEMPLQSYSEGMKARLGFAIAAHVNPQVMLVDEILAVGDAGFQRKCLRRIHEYLTRGGALVLVSHNMHLVKSVCQNCIVLDRGRIVFAGPSAEGIARYFDLNDDRNAPKAEPKLDETNPVAIESLTIVPVASSRIECGASMRIVLRYRALRDVVGVTWGFSLWTGDSETRITTSVAKYAGKVHCIRQGGGELSCIIKKVPLVPGIYSLRAGIYDAENAWPVARLGWEDSGVSFEITGPDTEANARHRIDKDIVELEVDWSV